MLNLIFFEPKQQGKKLDDETCIIHIDASIIMQVYKISVRILCLLT